MFKYCEYIKPEYNKKTNKYYYHYKIIDSDFEDIGYGVGIEIAVDNVYKRRNLNVGQNIALLCIYLSKIWHSQIENEIKYQDTHCQKYIDDWNEIKKDRDIFLQKYMLLV